MSLEAKVVTLVKTVITYVSVSSFSHYQHNKISKSLQRQQANVESSLKTKKFLISYFKFQNNLE